MNDSLAANAALPDDPDALVDDHQAALFYGVTDATFAKWREKQKGPAYVKLSPRITRYRVADLLEYARGNRIEPGVSNG